MTDKETEELSGIDPNIRRVVALLRAYGFDTTDSGDGSKYPEMGCALPMPNVFARVKNKNTLVAKADRLRGLIAHRVGEPKEMESGPSWHVEATYSPGGPSMVALFGVDDSMLPEDVQ